MLLRHLISNPSVHKPKTLDLIHTIQIWVYIRTINKSEIETFNPLI
jgi:hypothetical protein